MCEVKFMNACQGADVEVVPWINEDCDNVEVEVIIIITCQSFIPLSWNMVCENFCSFSVQAV